jgi:hypothetical protein
VAAINPERRGELKFSEYVHLVASYIMLSPKDLTRFLFQHADDEHRSFLRRDQFQKLLEMLNQGSPFNIKTWEIQYENFHGKWNESFHILFHSFLTLSILFFLSFFFNENRQKTEISIY